MVLRPSPLRPLGWLAVVLGLLAAPTSAGFTDTLASDWTAPAKPPRQGHKATLRTASPSATVSPQTDQAATCQPSRAIGAPDGRDGVGSERVGSERGELEGRRGSRLPARPLYEVPRHAARRCRAAPNPSLPRAPFFASIPARRPPSPKPRHHVRTGASALTECASPRALRAHQDRVPAQAPCEHGTGSRSAVMESGYAYCSGRFERWGRFHEQGHGRRRLWIALASVLESHRSLSHIKRRFHDMPSVHWPIPRDIAAMPGIRSSPRRASEGDVAIVLSSLVDYRREAAWANAMRARGMRVGFIGLASQLPDSYDGSADFIINGEPEAALQRLLQGEPAGGQEPADREPRRSAVSRLGPDRPGTPQVRVPFAGRPGRGSLPLLASRSCPEFCTYCPHRILALAPVVGNILDELSLLADSARRPRRVSRSSLHAGSRSRARARRRDHDAPLRHTFECETGSIDWMTSCSG